MKNPLISIIIPVFNKEQYLETCIKSVVEQTYTNLEIILVDDGSVDKSWDICMEWKKKDSRIIVVHQENKGVSVARNLGLSIAKGAYIGFVDADDYISSIMYETLLKTLLESEFKISCCYHMRNYQEHEQLKKSAKVKKFALKDAIDELFNQGDITTAVWDKLFEKSIFDEINFPEGETNEEFTILIPMFVKSGGIIHTGQYLYFYRAAEGSITNTYWKNDTYIVYKHINTMQEQVKYYNLKCEKSFRFFTASSAYSVALCLDKKYSNLDALGKKSIKKYLEIMRKNIFVFLLSGHANFKDKVLYLMLVTRVLRPIYKILGKD